ncbi:septum formation family protein [Leifsonia sp. NPDC058194]|uniref:septum formation family protein n=1 Tax=Leifsonia sp. NPDC058194 TaxID=3346374 RepID=UPI0036DA7ED7
MADHRDPASGDGDAEASSSSAAPGAEEPEFGSPEWLFRELGTQYETHDDLDDGQDDDAEPSSSAEAGPIEAVGTGPAPEAATPSAAPFTWNLTPGAGDDPLVRSDPSAPLIPAVPVEPEAIAPASAPASEAEPVPVEPEPVATVAPEPVLPPPPVFSAPDPAAPVLPVLPEPPATVTPPAAATTPPAATTPTEPPSFLASLRMPKPPEWDEPAAVPEAAPATSPVADESAPGQPATTEEPETTAPEPQSHGLAALLGYGTRETDAPASRSVIGDTTGIIPVVPGSLTTPPPTVLPPATVVPPPTVPPVAPPLFTPPPAVPPAFAAPTPPAEPVLPPPHPSELVEPMADGADVPTTKLDTAQMAALLAARVGDPDPLVPPRHVAPPEFPTTPVVPVVSVPEPEPEPEQAEPIVPVPVPVPEPEQEPEPEEPHAADDGLAALFGEVAEPEPEPETEPDGAPSSDAPTELFPGLAAEPGAAVEGPQFTEPLFLPLEGAPAAPLTVPQETLPAPVFAADPTVVIPAAATPPVAPPPVSPPVVPPAGAPGAAPETPGGGAGSSAGGPPPSRPRNPRNNRILFIVAGALAVVLVLIGLFALGTRLPALFGAAPSTPKASAGTSASATPTPTPTPTPTVTPKPGAPAAAGVAAWSALAGGECIEPYTTPWAESFTVVDCATPHTAQMVYSGILNPDIAAPYPGADSLAQQINGWCTAAGVIDLNAAAAYTGLQVQGTFPATEEQWKSGQRSYYCFATRSTGEPMTSSVAGPGPTG